MRTTSRRPTSRQISRSGWLRSGERSGKSRSKASRRSAEIAGKSMEPLALLVQGGRVHEKIRQGFSRLILFRQSFTRAVPAPPPVPLRRPCVPSQCQPSVHPRRSHAALGSAERAAQSAPWPCCGGRSSRGRDQTDLKRPLRYSISPDCAFAFSNSIFLPSMSWAFSKSWMPPFFRQREMYLTMLPSSKSNSFAWM